MELSGNIRIERFYKRRWTYETGVCAHEVPEKRAPFVELFGYYFRPNAIPIYAEM